MNTFGSRLRALLEALHVDGKDFADAIGVKPPTVSNWLNDNRFPKDDMLVAIADYFHVSLDFLLCRTDSPIEYAKMKIGESEITVSELMREPEPIDRDYTKLMRRLFGETHSPRPLPLLGTIRAGRPIPALEDYEGELDLSSECQADFALRVTGDSMSWAGIHHGDIALLVQGVEPRHGDIVAAGKADGDWSATLKYYISGGDTPRLRAANPKYPDIVMKPEENWSIVGTLVHVIKKAPGLSEYQRLQMDKEERDQKWDRVLNAAADNGIDPERLFYLTMALK